MPEISRFFGIVIRMYFLDHEPPHFHAHYGGAEGRMRIAPVGVLDGYLPPRVLLSSWSGLLSMRTNCWTTGGASTEISRQSASRRWSR